MKTITKRIDFDYLSSNDTAEKKPLVVYLHNSGEMGDYFAASRNVHRVVDKTNNMAHVLCPVSDRNDILSSDQIKCCIDDFCEVASVDLNKIYVVGHSLGGRNTWLFAYDYPEIPAAIIPVSGFSSYLRSDKILHIPTLAIHGKNDFLVPCEESARAIETMKMRGAKEAKLILLPGFGHGSSDVIFDPKVLKWLFSKSK